MIQSTMVSLSSPISILVLLFLFATTFPRSMANHHRVVRCNEKDRRTLSIFKQGVIDPSNQLSTWSTEADCCAWVGIQCDNTTGRLTKLDLNGRGLRGEINLSSLLELEFLNYLDLSDNDFDAISIPPIRDSTAKSRRHDNQSQVPSLYPFTNLSNLHYLDLSFNDEPIYMDNLHWLSQFSSIKYLNLSWIDLHKEANWLQLVATLPSLSELRLRNCQLTNISPSLKYVNFTSLVTLDLSRNNFSSELPHWLFNLSSDISYLSLWWSSLHGEIPLSLLNLRNLKHLDIEGNRFRGSIPDWLDQLEHLEYLDLSDNLFYGSIASTLGNLSSLVKLYVGSNSLSGALSEKHFRKLSNLQVLDLSNLALTFNLDPDWVPPFQLRWLYLSNTSQGPNFPSWIYTQKSLEGLDISNCGISSPHGSMFWSFVARIDWYLNVSYNIISGNISNVTLNATFLCLNHNNFTGGLPRLSTNAIGVDVSHNSFTGSIPNSWENCKRLNQIHSGSNRLFGELSLDLSNMTQLEIIDLGYNKFSGIIPTEMPETLKVMILRSNQFLGNIPPQLCNLSSLSHLDLADNNLSGSIPHCVYGFTNMLKKVDSNRLWPITFILLWPIKFNLFTKGHEYEYKYNWQSRSIDLSCNNLSGRIPSELFKLIHVQILNLSHNHLIGRIPMTIGDMKSLESLDLSYNEISGEIPQSMIVLSFLDYLNFSYNNFIGQIPSGTQLQTFDAWSYIGNPKLYGPPLTKNCTNEQDPENTKHVGNEYGITEKELLYLAMGFGFALSFWGIFGSLFLSRAWRHRYFRFLDQVVDQLYVTLMVKFNSFHKMEAGVK